MRQARIIGGPQHGHWVAVGPEPEPELRFHDPAIDRPCVFEELPQIRNLVIHRYRHAAYAADQRRFDFYVYQGPWAASRIAAFLYQRHMSNPRADAGPFPTGPEVDEIRRHEECATGLAEFGPRPYESPETSDRWLRTRAAEYADADGYMEEWAPC